MLSQKLREFKKCGYISTEVIQTRGINLKLEAQFANCKVSLEIVWARKLWTRLEFCGLNLENVGTIRKL